MVVQFGQDNRSCNFLGDVCIVMCMPQANSQEPVFRHCWRYASSHLLSMPAFTGGFAVHLRLTMWHACCSSLFAVYATNLLHSAVHLEAVMLSLLHRQTVYSFGPSKLSFLTGCQHRQWGMLVCEPSNIP